MAGAPGAAAAAGDAVDRRARLSALTIVADGTCGFDEVGLSRIAGVTRPAPARSRHVLEKLRMRDARDVDGFGIHAVRARWPATTLARAAFAFRSRRQ